MHPCQSCGACCASFRVSFHWSETLAESHRVPSDLTQPVTPHLLAMKGTDQETPRCQALDGVVGQKVSCLIYPNRSSTCRNFRPSFEDGYQSAICGEARSKRGLKPLKIEDWNQVSSTRLPLRHKEIALDIEQE
jgi:uncharacterized protein